MRTLLIIVTVLIASLTLRAEQFQVPATVAWNWNSPADFDNCYRDRYLDDKSVKGEVRLAHNMVIADEMGAEYDDYQPIHGKTWARKILWLDDNDVSSAMLLVGGWVKDCEILVNGQPIKDGPIDKTDRPYWNGDFDRFTVPPKLLMKGANQFLFRPRDEKSVGSIRIERSQQPNRSAVSHDGGNTWDSDHLAEGGYIDGEFQVRLNIGRYAPEAWIASPVMDLAAGVAVDEMPIGKNVRVDNMKVEAEIPKGTAVAVMLRTGSTPDGYEENWSRWYAWQAEKEQIKFERFVQWKLVLSTEAAQKTPVVKRVTLELEPHAGAAAPPFRITKDENQHIIRSSYDFAYSDYNGNLKVLRNNWKIADAVASGETEFSKLKLLRQWVREQWTDGWSAGKLNYIPSWDARITLSLSGNGRALGMCTHYATTYVQCSQALGYTSRSIFRGHALSETWSNEFKKWMVMDAGLDPNDKRRATYDFERAGVPLSELEVHKAFFVNKKWDDIQIVATNQSAGSAKPEEAFYGKEREKLVGMTRQMFLPLRNNFIDHREPEEPEHGNGYFKFLGHLFWKDATTPEVSWTDFFTTREADIYWTLNQAQIFLHADGKDAAGVSVMLDTVTPNFAGYEYRIDNGAWTAWNAGTMAAGVKAYPMKTTGGSIEFNWPLHAGANTVEARPVNKAGIRGIVSKVVVARE